MKTIMSILCVLLSFIAIPIEIYQIISGDRVILFSVLLVLSLPGFINALNYLYKKYAW